MKRKCIVCGEIYGVKGDTQNGSISGGICNVCMLAIEEYRFYRRMLKSTGIVEYETLMTNSLARLLEKEKKAHEKESKRRKIEKLNLKYQRR